MEMLNMGNTAKVKFTMQLIKLRLIHRFNTGRNIILQCKDYKESTVV